MAPTPIDRFYAAECIKREVDKVHKEAKAEAIEDMIAEGVLDEAREYAVRVITQFMLALGFEDVRIK